MLERAVGIVRRHVDRDSVQLCRVKYVIEIVVTTTGVEWQPMQFVLRVVDVL